MDRRDARKRHAAKYFETFAAGPLLKKRALRGGGATIFSQFVVYWVRLVGLVVLARILAPDEFGLIAMLGALVAYLRLLARNLGLTDATVQQQEINHRQVSALFWINVASGFGMTLLLIALAPAIAWFYDEPQLRLIAVVSSAALFLGGLSAQHRALLRRNMSFFKIALNEITAAVLSISVSIVLALRGWSYWSLVIGRLTAELAETVGAWVLCEWRPGLPRRAPGVRGMVRFGATLSGSLSIAQLARRIDVILLGWRWGAVSVGLYTKALNVFIAPAQQLAWPLSTVAVSTLSRLRGDPLLYRRYYLKAVSFFCFFGLPASAILFLVSDDLVFLLLGPQWVSASTLLSVLALALGAEMIYFTHGWIHVSLGRADRRLYWSFLEAAIIGGGMLLGLPYGAIGIAVAYAVTRYVLTTLGLWYAGLPIGLTIPSIASVVAKYFVAAFGAGFLAWFVLYSWPVAATAFADLHLVLRILSTSLLCGSSYLLFLLCLARGTDPIREVLEIVRQGLLRAHRKEESSTGAEVPGSRSAAADEQAVAVDRTVSTDTKDEA